MKDFELFISNNGTTDSTLEICLEYKQEDKRIKNYLNRFLLILNYNFK